jgi:metal-responsive CopG/Arc/MetJ family transcriptional regulator
MTQAIVDLPETLLNEIDAIAARVGKSRGSLLREAVAQFLLQNGSNARQTVFGIWADRDEDGLDYQKRLRDEWNER